MEQYNVPWMAFVNMLDRQGANPWLVINNPRNQLKLNISAVQVPVGLKNGYTSVVELLPRKGAKDKYALCCLPCGFWSRRRATVWLSGRTLRTQQNQ